MLLRSSSTRLFQSHDPQTFTTTRPSAINGLLHHHHHLTSFSSNSSPTSHPICNRTGVRRNSLRKAHSDSNLYGLYSTSCPLDQLSASNSYTLTRSLKKRTNSMLRTEPSFCIYNSEDGVDGLSHNEDVEEQLVRSLTIGDSIEGLENGEFSFGKKSMGLIEEQSDEEEAEEGKVLNGITDLGVEDQIEPPSPPMYLATGFGIDDNGVGGGPAGGGVDLRPVWADDGGDVEEYYKRMITEDPSNPLFLRNYAQLLQLKGDLHGAEDYYLRATLLDPKDGEILMQYAKLVWELHHDQDKAMNYFECATRASPQDSNVLAAYASFLWEIDEDNDDEFAHTDQIQVKEEDCLVKVQNSAFEVERPISPPLHLAAGLGIDYSAPLLREGENIEERYKRMVDENPCNPLFLRNYAQFLCQSKGDLKGAEEYYSRAILADPMDGDIISQYAKLVWKHHHDRDKASSYFEQAVRATPSDCNVLAAYAGFLWETEEEDEEENSRDELKVPVFQGQDITPTHA